MRTKKNPEIPMVPKIHLKNVEHQRDQYKAERDTLIDDLKVLREKNEKLQKQHTTLTDHIRLKASANPGEHRYIALVNFIDRLERNN